MAYPREIKIRAYEMFAMHLGYEDIAQRLRGEFPEICPLMRRQTIAKWSDEQGWPERRDALDRRVAEARDDKLVTTRSEIIQQVSEIRKALLPGLLGRIPKSLEGGVNAYVNLAKLELELSGERAGKSGKLDIDKAIMIVFNVLIQDPKLGPIMKERQQFIAQEIHSQLEAV